MDEEIDESEPPRGKRPRGPFNAASRSQARRRTQRERLEEALAELPFMPLWCADYLTATAHLDTTASGAYLHLLMHYWLNQGGFDQDEKKLARLARLSPADWKKYRTDILAFFTLKDGILTNERAEEEIAAARRRSELGKAAAEARWINHVPKGGRR